MKSWQQHRLMFCLLAVLCWPVMVSASARPDTVRFVSVNLCADQLLLQWAEPESIAAVSAMAKDAAISLWHERATNYPAVGQVAEAVLAHRPDILFSGPWLPDAVRHAVEQGGGRVEAFPILASVEEMRTAILRMAKLLGAEKKASDSLARFGRALAHLRQVAHGWEQQCGHRLSVLLLHPNGYTEGKGTFWQDMLSHAGLRNALPDAGGYYAVSLEWLATHPPEMLVITRGYGVKATSAASLAEAWLRHPALQRLPSARKEMHGALLSCPGTELADWLEAWAEQIATLPCSRERGDDAL
jgi:iron complex transport system substrate-binding protein